MTNKEITSNYIKTSEHNLLISLNLELDFEQGMAQLYRKNQLSNSEWLPIFQTLKKEHLEPKQYSIKLINKKNPNISKLLMTDDIRISNFIDKYDEQKHFISTESQRIKNSADSINSNIEPVNTLNTASIIRAILNPEDDPITKNTLSDNLKIALQIHNYTNWAQLSWGAIEDTIKYISLWSELANHSGVSGKLFQTVSRASPYLTIGLNLFSSGLNGYELANAQNEAQRSIYSTQLAFDLANLANTGVSVGANILGAPTVASFAGYLGVPLAGLGIGISALVQGTQIHIEKTKAVGRYFGELDDGYRQGGYQIVEIQDKNNKANLVWKSIPGIAIKTLDLRQKRVGYADSWIYKTYIYGDGSGYANHITWVTPASVNRVGSHHEAKPKEKVINIREGINYHDATSILNISNNIPIILPDTPQHYIDYIYETFPFVTARNDRGFEVLRRLESNYRDNRDNFSFDFYNFPSERAISELKFEFINTPIEVLLGDNPYSIVMPMLSKEMKGKLTYTLVGGKGAYHISLQEGAILVLSQGHQETDWILDTRALKGGNQLVFGQHSDLQAGELSIKLSADFQGQLHLINDEGTFLVNPLTKEITPERRRINALQFAQPQQLQDYLKEINSSDYRQPFIPVENYQISDNALTGIAFYDTQHKRFIYTNAPDEVEFLRGSQLAAVEDNRAWLYRDDRVWQVDINTGDVLREYLPLSLSIIRKGIQAFSHKTITDIKPSNSQLFFDKKGMLYFIVEYQYDTGPVHYTWQITQDSRQLIAIMGKAETLQQILSLIGDNNNVGSFPLFNAKQAFSAKNGQEIKLLSLQDGMYYHAWAKKIDGMPEYQIYLQFNLAYAPEDIQPIPVIAGNNKGYYFYSDQQGKLYFQKDNGADARNNLEVIEVKSDVSSLSTQNGLFIVQDKNGIRWIADSLGNLSVMGVTHDWLLKNKENMSLELYQLAKQEITLPAIRLQSIDNNWAIGWYDVAAKKIIYSGVEADVSHDIHYRGLSSDEKQIWLYNSDNQQLYRQSLIQHSDVIHSERWSSDKYLSVVSMGNTLRLIRQDGAVLLLNKNAVAYEQMQLIGWQETKVMSERQRKEIIEDLRGKVIFAPALRWFSEKMREPTWYLSKQKIFVSALGLSDKHSLRYLGQASDQSSHYIHDQDTSELWQVNSSNITKYIGKYRFIAFDEYALSKKELVLQHVSAKPEIGMQLPLLENANSLIINGQTDEVHYQLNKQLLSHYQQIIIDERGMSPIIDLPDLDGGLIQHIDQDMVWFIPQLKTRIVIANIQKAADQNMVFKYAMNSEFSASNLLKSFERMSEVYSGEDRQFKLSITSGYLQLQYVDQPSSNVSDYREYIGSTVNNSYRFLKGDGTVVIQDSGGVDTLSFLDINYDELIFRRNGENLVIQRKNSEDSISIQNAFSSSVHQIEKIITSDLMTLDTSLLYQAMNELLFDEELVSLPSGALTVQDSEKRVSQLSLSKQLMWQGSNVITDNHLNYLPIKPNNLLFLQATDTMPFIVLDRYPAELDTASDGKVIRGNAKNKNIISVANGYGIRGETTIYGGMNDDILHVAGGQAKLHGGYGNDVYRVGGSTYYSHIFDRGGEQDLLSLEYKGIKPSSIALQRQGDNLQIAIADSSLVTIHNQFKGESQAVVEKLALKNNQQNWHYSLVDLMSSLQTGGVFGLTETGGISQINANIFPPFSHHSYKNLDPR